MPQIVTTTTPRIFKMREEALDGYIFYDNTLTAPENKKRFFPPFANQLDYDLYTKQASPITSAIINRIRDLAFKNIEITPTIPELSMEFLKEILKNSLIGGNCLIIPSTTGLQLWKGQFIGIDEQGYYLEYILDVNGSARPVLKSKFVISDKEKYIIQNLGTLPTLFTCIDCVDELGRPFPERFKDSVIEYNRILTQISRNLRIFQETWITNREVDNPDRPLVITPGRINYLGQDGTLEQVENKYDSNDSREYMHLLRDDIAQAAQCPQFMRSLEDLGKIPSGVALSIMMQPLTELLASIRSKFIEQLQTLVGNANITFSIPDIALDKNAEISQLVELVKAGILTPQEAHEYVIILLEK
jgi:hypothetical protein